MLIPSACPVRQQQLYQHLLGTYMWVTENHVLIVLFATCIDPQTVYGLQTNKLGRRVGVERICHKFVIAFLANGFCIIHCFHRHISVNSFE